MAGASEDSARTARADPTSEPAVSFWAIVLAGGEGIRLRSLIRRLYADDRPKQYASLFGSRSLLGVTLDRVAYKVPLCKTVVVTSRWHAQYAAAEFAGSPTPRLLVQPSDRGTAAGVLFPVHWIRRQEPKAILAVFPSDHFVRDDLAFMNHVEELALYARRHPDRLLLVGARPFGPEIGYGWIEPADPLDEAGPGAIRRVRRFWEKPSAETVRSCFENGHLWNTFVMVGSAAAFVEAGRRYLPGLDAQLTHLAPFFDTEAEQKMVDRAYASVPRADFSRAILEACPPFLAVSRLPDIGWSDWGTPERVIAGLKTAGISPPWLREQPLPA